MHTLRVLDASVNPGVSIGSATINLMGGSVGFVYGTLSSPVTLAASGLYIICSSEVSGGDAWYDQGTQVTTTGDANILQPAIVDSSFNWTTTSGANHDYGPMDFKYHL